MVMNEDMSLPESSPKVLASPMRATTPVGPLSSAWVESPTILDVKQPDSSGLGRYLHALRRRWLVAITLGVLCAMALVPVAWLLYVPAYTAEYYLTVSPTEQQLLFNTGSPDTNFDVFKRTQQASMKNPLVLMAALREPEINNLSIVLKQRDPDWWLQKELEVDFPNDAEWMRVSLTAGNQYEVAKVVKAVVDSYMERFVEAEKRRRDNRREALEVALSEGEAKLEEKQEELRDLARTFGAADSETLVLKQRNKLQELFEYRKELASVELELMLDGFRAQGVPSEGAENQESAVTDYEQRRAERSDPEIGYLKQRLMQLGDELNEIAGTTNSEVAAVFRERLRAQFDADEERLEARREFLREELQMDKDELLEEDRDNRAREAVALSLYKKQLEGQVEELETQFDNMGGPTVQSLMLRKEIDVLDQTVSTIASEVEKLNVERASGERIVRFSGDTAHSRCTNQNLRITMAILAGVVGFLLPAYGIVFWDTRGQRVNSRGEVSEEVGLDVIGEIPIIPLRAVRHLADSSPRYHHWQNMLTESVDGIAARLLRRAESDPTQVIMVSSAVSGEGKTTVATQLAMSLARTGRETILVDFDLRRPSLDSVFGIPIQPGVGELLKHEIELPDAIHSKHADRLSVIAAGRWNSGSIEVLANGSTSALFNSLRAEYDFVIVDGSPLLPVADTRFISQHTDGVVLSVLRDISRIPKVAAACEVLAAFDVRVLGAVVTGARQDQYYGDSKYLKARGK